MQDTVGNVLQLREAPWGHGAVILIVCVGALAAIYSSTREYHNGS